MYIKILKVKTLNYKETATFRHNFLMTLKSIHAVIGSFISYNNYSNLMISLV